MTADLDRIEGCRNEQLVDGVHDDAENQDARRRNDPLPQTPAASRAPHTIAER